MFFYLGYIRSTIQYITMKRTNGPMGKLDFAHKIHIKSTLVDRNSTHKNIDNPKHHQKHVSG